MSRRFSVLAALLAAPTSGQLLLEPLDGARAQGLRGAPGAVVRPTASDGPEGDVPTTALASPNICDPNVTQHSGYLAAGPETRYFFWFFESRRSPSKDPLVLWLSGGPGCSSQLALLALNGPCSVSASGETTIPNPHSWTEHANVLWVDQPGSTGFSYGPRPHGGTEAAAERMFEFLKRFYAALPQYLNNDFYVFGESYAGHYVPAVAHHIWQQGNQGGFKMPLRGLGVGNGLTNPEEQFKWYPDMALDGGRSFGGSLERGIVRDLSAGEEILEAMRESTGACTRLIRACNTGNSTEACLLGYELCTSAMLTPYQLTGANIYDMRIPCEVPGLCYDFSNVEVFLNLPETQRQLGVERSWGSCSSRVNQAFQADWMVGYHTKLPDMLAAGLRVLIYAGDTDYICNWLGNKKWTLALDWEHKAAFNAAEDQDYLAAGRQAGRLRSAHGLHFLQVYQAGHMVPMDQPAVAQAMLGDFLSGRLGAALSPPRLI